MLETRTAFWILAPIFIMYCTILLLEYPRRVASRTLGIFLV